MESKKYLLDKAITLRKSGHSLNEISRTLNISKSTASLWLSNVKLSSEAKATIEKKIIISRLKSAQSRINNTQKQLDILSDQAEKLLGGIRLSSTVMKILCSLIYWCEGGKSKNPVHFTNSDPKLVKTFLYLFRKSYQVDEKKFRAIIHLHSYHNKVQQTAYWSKITKIPLNQFTKPFQKKNSGKRINKNYQGCIQIKYYDTKILNDLLAVAKAFMNIHGGVG